MKPQRILLLGLLLWGTTSFAEAPAPGTATDQSTVLTQEVGAAEGTQDGEDQAEARAKLLQKLSAKLLNHKGQPVSVVVFTPMDFTTAQVGGIVANSLVTSLKKYGNLNVRQENYSLETLTLGEFRKGMAQFKVDVLVATSIRNTTFDLYIYDRRTPYYIYAHSEPIPEATQLHINEEVANYYSRIVLRRALYRYINDQYFELPRQDSAPVLQSEIPRWIASPESIAQINRELVASMYFGVSSGGAFTFGSQTGKSLWNSPLLSLQFGIRVYDNLFSEIALMNGAYNTGSLSFKYNFANRDRPYRISVGLGFAYATPFKVFVSDRNASFNKGTGMIVSSISFLFPIGDVYLKLEEQNYLNFKSGTKLMFTLLPGILIHF